MVQNLLLLSFSDDTSEIIFIIVGFIVAMVVVPFVFSAIFNKATKEAEEGNGSCLGIFFIVFFIIFIIMNIAMCSDSLKQCEGNDYWEPRHTQLIVPTNKTIDICPQLYNLYC